MAIIPRLRRNSWPASIPSPSGEGDANAGKVIRIASTPTDHAPPHMGQRARATIPFYRPAPQAAADTIERYSFPPLGYAERVTMTATCRYCHAAPIAYATHDMEDISFHLLCSGCRMLIVRLCAMEAANRRVSLVHVVRELMTSVLHIKPAQAH